MRLAATNNPRMVTRLNGIVDKQLGGKRILAIVDSIGPLMKVTKAYTHFMASRPSEGLTGPYRGILAGGV